MSPDRLLRTSLVLDDRGRIQGTREPGPTPGPRFVLIRGASACAWAVRADVPDEVEAAVRRLIAEEPLAPDAPPRHADAYRALVGGTVTAGPSFGFPRELPAPGGLALVTELPALEWHFRGWTASELPGRQPIVAVVEDGFPVSVCFCARLADDAAHAGVETAAAHRGRGHAAKVVAAWATAIRAAGRIAVYSTAWTNTASLAVAHKLRLIQEATDWSLT